MEAQREVPPTPLIVELGRARVTVPSGFDRGTLTAVLDVLATRGGL